MTEERAEVRLEPTEAQRKFRKLMIIALAALLLLAVVSAGGHYYIRGLLQPMPPGAEATVVIPPGTGSAGIAGLLERQGIIRNAMAFKAYLKSKGQGTRFQAGTYLLAPGLTYDEIIAKLNAGETVKAETIKFTVPEGYTVVQVAERLAEQGLADAEAFLAAEADPSWLDNPLLTSIPADRPLKQRLEGYLFPETYELRKGSTERDMIRRMVEEMERKRSTLPADWPEKLEASGFSWHDVLTVASLVEREVVVDKERAIVAGIIYRRLAKGMPLQIDATVQYALEKPKERLLHVDLKLESPYNTYLHDGLPPGPIASPGIESIRAALYPEKSDYLFYVTKKDGSRRHLFAETFEQHQRNIEASNQNAKAGGTP